MRYRSLGPTGLQLSEIASGPSCLGCNRYSDGLAILKTAYDAGVNFFDNAEAYNGGWAEIEFGRAWTELGLARDSFAVSSKVLFSGDRPMQRGLSRKHLRDACDGALKRMQVDYSDLFMCHRPDAQTPPEEIARAMSLLVDQGKVLWWGTSEFATADIVRMVACCRSEGLHLPVVEQPGYNLLWRHQVECELQPLYADPGLGITVCSPGGAGLLCGRNDASSLAKTAANPGRYINFAACLTPDRLPATTAYLAGLDRLAAQAGMPLHRFALSWVLANPRVSCALTSVSRFEQLEGCLRAGNEAPLSADLLTAVDALARTHGFLPAPGQAAAFPSWSGTV